MENPKPSIVQIDPSAKIRNPQQRKQLRTALILLAVIISAAVISWVLLNNKSGTYELGNYNSARAESGTLAYSAEGSGAVDLSIQYVLHNPETGYVKRLYTVEGEFVETDQLLAVLDVPELEEDLDEAEEKLNEAKLDHERFVIQNKYSLTRAEREIEKLEEDISEAGTDLEYAAVEYEKGWISKSELESKQEIKDDLAESLEDKRLNSEEDQTLYEIDLKINQSVIRDLEKSITDLHKRIASARIMSPLSGDVLSLNSSLQVPGSEINENVTLFTIGQPDSAIAIVEVDEKYSSLLKTGDKARMLIGTGWTTGTVTSVGKVAVLSSDGVTSTIEVKIKPDEQSSSLIQGASVTAEFPLGESGETLLLPRGAYLTTGSQKYIYVIDGKKAFRREVEFGEIQDMTVQVVSGLTPGDEVITSGYQNFIEYEQIDISK